MNKERIIENIVIAVANIAADCAKINSLGEKPSNYNKADEYQMLIRSRNQHMSIFQSALSDLMLLK